MRKPDRALVVTLAVRGAAALMVPGPTTEAAPPGDPPRSVSIISRPAWRGSAAGEHGGVSFGVSCNSGSGVERLRGVRGRPARSAWVSRAARSRSATPRVLRAGQARALHSLGL